MEASYDVLKNEYIIDFFARCVNASEFHEQRTIVIVARRYTKLSLIGIVFLTAAILFAVFNEDIWWSIGVVLVIYFLQPLFFYVSMLFFRDQFNDHNFEPIEHEPHE